MSELDGLALPVDIPPKLLSAWEEFRRKLEPRGPGVLSLADDEPWSINDEFDPEDEAAVARLAITALLVPHFVAALAERVEDGDGSWESETLRAFGRLGIAATRSSEPVARLGWEIDGARMAWAGRFEFWGFAPMWRTLTATYEREALGDYLPVLLGFVREDAAIEDIASLIQSSTVGWSSSRPNRIWWEGLTAREAVILACGMGEGDERQPLTEFDPHTVLEWSASLGSNGRLSLEHLAGSVSEEQLIRDTIADLEGRFSQTMSERRARPAELEVNARARIDALSAHDNEFLTRWFDHHRLQRFAAIRWSPHGVKYRIRVPVVTIHFADGTETWIPFPGASEAPLLTQLLPKIPPKDAVPNRIPGESDLAFADYLWCRGFHSEASAFYRSA